MQPKALLAILATASLSTAAVFPRGGNAGIAAREDFVKKVARHQYWRRQGDETSPTDATPAESTPNETIPVDEAPTTPDATAPDGTPDGTTPAEVPPSESSPIETPPSESTPVETPPSESTPIESPPSESTPVETPPGESSPGGTAPGNGATTTKEDTTTKPPTTQEPTTSEEPATSEKPTTSEESSPTTPNNVPSSTAKSTSTPPPPEPTTVTATTTVTPPLPPPPPPTPVTKITITIPNPVTITVLPNPAIVTVVPKPPPNVRPPPYWVVKNYTRTCNAVDTSCNYLFWIETHNDPWKPFPLGKCNYTVEASPGVPASRQSVTDIPCEGGFRASSAWSGQFGPGNGFTTYGVTNYVGIIWPAYADWQVKNNTPVKPDQLYFPLWF